MLSLLAQARRAGVHIDIADGWRVTGPAHLANEIRRHRKPLRYWLSMGRAFLDWHDRPMIRHNSGCMLCCDTRDDRGRHPKDCATCLHWRGPRPDPCVLCGRIAHLEEGGHPIHKACAEQRAWEHFRALIGAIDQLNAA